MNDNQQKYLIKITYQELFALYSAFAVNLAFYIVIIPIWIKLENIRSFYMAIPLVLLSAANFLAIIITMLCWNRR